MTTTTTTEVKRCPLCGGAGEYQGTLKGVETAGCPNDDCLVEAIDKWANEKARVGAVMTFVDRNLLDALRQLRGKWAASCARQG